MDPDRLSRLRTLTEALCAPETAGRKPGTPEGVAASNAPDTVMRQWVLARWPPGDGSSLDRFLEKR